MLRAYDGGGGCECRLRFLASSRPGSINSALLNKTENPSNGFSFERSGESARLDATPSPYAFLSRCNYLTSVFSSTTTKTRKHKNNNEKIKRKNNKKPKNNNKIITKQQSKKQKRNKKYKKPYIKRKIKTTTKTSTYQYKLKTTTTNQKQ